MDFLSVEKRIEGFIASRVERAGADGVVLGLSGGLDSATVAALCARALGPDRVLALIMPAPVSPHRDVEAAKKLAHGLGVRQKTIPLRSILEAFREHLDNGDKRAMGNLAARVRMTLLYYQANRLNYLVVGTGNKSEISVGYTTKYGDSACDILPLGDLYKTEVRELAKSLGVPESVIEKTPSAGLWPGQTDEGELGMSYEELDKALKEGADMKVQRMVNAAEHKRTPPEVCSL